MTAINVTDSKIIKYQFEVGIARAPDQVWSIMTKNIDAWWMTDFRALGENSKVSLDPRTGGVRPPGPVFQRGVPCGAFLP